MSKIATRYYMVDPWKVIENGFRKDRGMVSESIFSLANEYMGVRGFFDEDYTNDKLIGTYFNKIYEVPEKQEGLSYKGISKKNHFMVNSVNWLKTRLIINDVVIDLNKVDYKDFIRVLDFKTGELTREYKYTSNKTLVRIKFKRLIDMIDYQNAYQQILIESLSGDINVKLVSSLDYGIKHFGSIENWNIDDYQVNDGLLKVIGRTKHTGQKIHTIARFKTKLTPKFIYEDKKIGYEYEFTVKEGEEFAFEKVVTNYKYFNNEDNQTIFKDQIIDKSYEEGLRSNKNFFQNVWNNSDIEIDGDDLNQQGIRFCIFQMISTYQGLHLMNNIGAKGLTGEAYSGHAFWDTETYCLPFYLFNKPSSAKDLLMFRYNTLSNAIKRARELDSKGACFPIATLNGDEACNLWQHASLQFQPTSGVAYGIFHYVNVSKDYEFLYNEGIEMLVQISRFFASRGDFDQNHAKYGFYGVMGPDEFQIMVNNNTYTNYMAKFCFDYTVETLRNYEKYDKDKYIKFLDKVKISKDEIDDFIDKSNMMCILYDEKTKLYEQHEGYYNLPHIDISKIPVNDFPLYSHWSYDRIYRNDMIKQPDVLMFMLLFNTRFSNEVIAANYNFYEPRTIHESSLSPSVHSILALQINKLKEGLDFFGFATRMDLDDYNRNTCEGLHITSLSAAWLNIIYGFGGLRSDGKILKLNPTIPSIWKKYTFRFTYQKALIIVTVEKDRLLIESNNEVTLEIYNKSYIFKGKLEICGK